VATPFRVELVTPERVLFLRRRRRGLDAYRPTARLPSSRSTRTSSARSTSRSPAIHVVDGSSSDADEGEDLIAAVTVGSSMSTPKVSASSRASRSSRARSTSTGHGRRSHRPRRLSGVEERPSDHADDAGEAEPDIAKSPAMIALLEPESADARTRRARTRLEAAGVTAQA